MSADQLEDQPLFAELQECSEGCPGCEVEETRALALAAPDWRKLGNSTGIHPSDMRRFIEAQIILTAPARQRIREVLAKENAA